MNYEGKYLKYKHKYLELKRLIGGDIVISSENKKDYIITNVDSKIFENPEHFSTEIKKKIKTIDSVQFDKENNKIIITLINNKSIIDIIKQLIDKFYKKYLSTDIPLTTIISKPASTIPRVISPPVSVAYNPCEPWAICSKTIYVSLVIDPNSEAGKFIYEVRNKMCKEKKTNMGCLDEGTTMYHNILDGKYYPEGFLHDPHITLFSLYIPSIGYLNSLLNNDDNYFYLINGISDICKKHLNQSAKILETSKDDFVFFGNYAVRKYNDISNSPDIIINNILKEVYKFIYETIIDDVLDERQIITGIEPFSNCKNKSIVTFTHIINDIPTYKIANNFDYFIQNSLFAVVRHSTGFKPHLSYFKKDELNFPHNNEKALFCEIKSRITKPKENINFWFNKEEKYGKKGDISHVYISCNRDYRYL